MGEPLPTDPGRQRLHRSGILAELLAARGVDVVWWTSAFNHFDKTFRCQGTTWSRVDDHLQICCLASRPYLRNVSIARIRANRDIARAFEGAVRGQRAPDVILASYPIPELALSGARYAAAHGIPAVVDVRDLWPDVWHDALPRPLRRFGRLGALPFYWQSRRTLQAFQGICGITDEFVQWGLDRGGRLRGKWDRAFPLAYVDGQYPHSERQEAQKFWTSIFDGRPTARLRLCFFGNIAMERARIDVMLEAVRRLPQRVRDEMRLILCGRGEDFEAVRAAAEGMPQIVLPGWVTGPQIEALAAQSHAGLLPYPSTPDFTRSLPNKAVEYLAYGLPILTSLKGPVSQLIDAEHCGLLYRETDPDDLAHRIEELFDAPARIEQLSTNARRVFRDRFQAAQVYGRFADMLTELASAGRASA
ncbi:MAG: glycosyltransferase family 4 protein [Enhydrobacter sp.]|nr:MAG: glycosyltransferase family 4 protein [Enhydrobacter sp.]